jgi:hypothetical protein
MCRRGPASCRRGHLWSLRGCQDRRAEGRARRPGRVLRRPPGRRPGPHARRAGATRPASNSTSTGCPPARWRHQALDSGFATVFWGGRPPQGRKVPRRDVCSLAGSEAHPIRAGGDPQLHKLVGRQPVRQERQRHDHAQRPTDWCTHVTCVNPLTCAVFGFPCEGPSSATCPRRITALPRGILQDGLQTTAQLCVGCPRARYSNQPL